MIQPSSITNTAKAIIQKKLQEIAQVHKIRILLAVESGSRAWGFPSINSDYDVRFIYARHPDEYLSIKEFRDVIETQIQYESSLGTLEDLNGWDIRKALYLAIKSNPVLFEWIQSPIQYGVDESSIQALFEFCKENANLDLIKNHYYKLAFNAWRQIEEDPHQVKVKLYCYGLRPALMLQWLNQFNSVPPMDMHSLACALIKDSKLEHTIDEMIAIKATAQEEQKISRSPLIDSFIVSLLSEQPKDYGPVIISDEQLIKGDKLFRAIIT